MEGGAIKQKVCKMVALGILMFAINVGIWGFEVGVEGAGARCGKLDPEVVAYKLAPCAAASQDKNVTPPRKCCDLVKRVDVACLCDIILSKEAKSLGIKPEIAVTIPLRCRNAGRPKGYKCGAYTVP